MLGRKIKLLVVIHSILHIRNTCMEDYTLTYTNMKIRCSVGCLEKWDDDESVEALLLFTLLEMGGRDSVMTKNEHDRNLLQTAYSDNLPFELISRLIHIGGRDLVIANIINGLSSLQCACHNFPSVQVVSKLIEVGGRDLVMENAHKSD